MSFADELKAEVEKIEADIDTLFHHDEVVVDDDKKAVLADAKTDAESLKTQIDTEAPQVEADASEALKNGVSDLSSKVANVVEDPANLDSDLKSAGEEFEAQEKPAAEQVEAAAEADVKTDKAQVDEQVHGLQVPDAAHDGDSDQEEEASVAPVADGVTPPLAGAPSVGPASAEPEVKVEEDPEEGSVAAEVKANVDKLKADFKDAQESVPEPAEGAETPETFANRLPRQTGADPTLPRHEV